MARQVRTSGVLVLDTGVFVIEGIAPYVNVGGFDSGTLVLEVR